MIDRRTALGLIGAAAGVATTGRLAHAAEPGAVPRPNLNDSSELLKAYRKLAHSFDDSVTFWWMRGTRYGVVDAIVTPFWDMHIGTWFTTETLEGDAYAVTAASANFYTPPNSTKLLEVFRNPYTGADVPVDYAPPRPRRRVMGSDEGASFGGEIPGMTTLIRTADKGPGWIEGDDVVIRGDTFLHAVPTDPDSAARPFIVNDWSTYVGSVADIVDPKVKNAPAVQYFNDILTWPAWLQMGDQPGNYVSRCFGRKVFAYEQMPALWRALFEYALPESAKDPSGALRVS